MSSGIMGVATKLAAKLFGTKHQKDIKRLDPVVAEINEHFAGLAGLTDEELKARTAAWQAEFRAIWADTELTPEQQEATVRDRMDDILPEAYAVVKEACRRHAGTSWPVVGMDIRWDMVPYDVQLIGGCVLHEGKIAEMATGEGKTLVALMPLYLNALPGRGAHLITVNDYLARRDSEWVGRILTFLGLTVGTIQHSLEPPERRMQYACDVTYGTNNEFGFDYLRDNMAVTMEERVQRGFWYSIVDEVDSVLVDEARTPLIISGPVEHSTQYYDELKPAIERVVRKQLHITQTLTSEAEALLALPTRTQDQEWQLAVKLLQIRRGSPKNKKFMKLMSEDPGLQRVVQKIELDFIRDKKMGDLDAELCYSIDEKSHSLDLSDLGRETIAPNDPEMFILPDLSLQIDEIESAHRIEDDLDESTDGVDRASRALALARAREEAHRDYAMRADRVHSALQMLKAYSLYEKDVEYVVQDGKILIVDEFTGRLMPGRRYSDGLHQAIEAKENVHIEGETQTLATITLQNFFRMYAKLAGMTGTAETEAGEFFEIYKLDTVVIPTNRPIRRVDFNDVIYRTRREKYNAIIDEVARLNGLGIPILVGTVSVEVSETLSRLLARRGIRHHVLNAKQHQREAEIVTMAGQKGAVTIATNMAGRGTDIKLGPGVLEDSDRDQTSQLPSPKEPLGGGIPRGLAIIGTERHESRRIDRQLRGRSGRQGDPGSSRFFLSLEDDLMRLFGIERIAGLMDKTGFQEGEAIEHPLVTRAIERAQKRVEEHNFSIRKHLLEYDDVMNKQREVIYEKRLHILEGEDISELIQGYMDEEVARITESHLDVAAHPSEWDLATPAGELEIAFLHPFSVKELEGNLIDLPSLTAHFQEQAREAYRRKEAGLPEGLMREVERRIGLRVIDGQWRDHLHEIDLVKEGIGLRAYGQKDPLLEYKKEAFNTFAAMNERIREETVKNLFRVSVVTQDEAPAPPPPRPAPFPTMMTTTHASFSPFSPAIAAGLAGPEGGGGEEGAVPATPGFLPTAPESAEPSGPKVGRNDPCPCGSGKKYKKCHGANA